MTLRTTCLKIVARAISTASIRGLQKLLMRPIVKKYCTVDFLLNMENLEEEMYPMEYVGLS
jgi:hypothetical protein